jgi:hypothetical protein
MNALNWQTPKNKGEGKMKNTVAYIEFRANGKKYSHMYERCSPDDDVKEITAFIRANKVRKQDMTNCKITMLGWGFWADFEI